MTIERSAQGQLPEAPIQAADADAHHSGAKLQVLATEHWSLLATRSLTWNEIYSRSSMFLSALSGSIVALALVAQVTSLGESFVTFALVILPVVLFLGLTTYIRLVQANTEDGHWVTGMNRIRAGYLAIVPELEPYLITSAHDDLEGLRITAAFVPIGHPLVFGFVTAPAVVGVIDAVLAGVIVAIVATQLGASTLIAIGLAIIGAGTLFAWGASFSFRLARKWVGNMRPLNPSPEDTGEGSTAGSE